MKGTKVTTETLTCLYPTVWLTCRRDTRDGELRVARYFADFAPPYRHRRRSGAAGVGRDINWGRSLNNANTVQKLEDAESHLP